jgi:hypothetical protein
VRKNKSREAHVTTPKVIERKAGKFKQCYDIFFALREFHTRQANDGTINAHWR